MMKRDARLLLENIRSVHNVGSIFRTAETLGIGKIYCLGTTPVPVDRFDRKRMDFAKVSLGAEESVGWEHVEGDIGDSGPNENPATLIKGLKKEGFKIVALEQAAKSVDYKEVKAGEKILVILGNEVDGVSPELLKMCDEIAEIPMNGQKESLNVSVAAGVFLFRLLDN